MGVELRHPLFRPEVAESRKNRLHGEIILAQPVRSQVLAGLLFLLIALIGFWIALGNYTRTETAPGILVTDAASAKIVAIRPGQIVELNVKEGDLVQYGQRLATIRVEQSNEAGGSAVAESLAALDIQQSLVEQQIALAGQRAAAERSRLTATLSGISQQSIDLKAQIDLQQQVVASAQDMFDRLGSIVEKGFVSRIEYERRRQAVLAARQQLAQLMQQANALVAEERRTGAELARTGADAGTEIVSARTSAQTLAQQRAQAVAQRAYTLTAPIAGRVTALQASPGRTVDAAVPLMVIVPEGSTLHADVYAPTRAIGFVRPGQEVRLLYDAFPYQRFGSFKGRVTRVSRTAIDPRELAAPLKIEEAVYRIEVTPDRQSVEAFGERLPLQPGMSLTASLILDRRSFADWLLQPLNAVLKRSGE